MHTVRQSLNGWRDRASTPSPRQPLPLEMPVSSSLSERAGPAAGRLLADNGGGIIASLGVSVRTVPASGLGSGRAYDTGRVSTGGLDEPQGDPEIVDALMSMTPASGHRIAGGFTSC